MPKTAGTIQEAYDRLVEAAEAESRAARSGKPDAQTGLTQQDAEKGYYLALFDFLRAFNAPSNWRKDDELSEVPLPRFVAFALGRVLDDLASGHVPQGIANHFFRPNRPGHSAATEAAIISAARYVLASRNGLIADESAASTVAEWFGVKPTTVRRWVRAHREVLASVLRMPSSEVADILTRHMQENSLIYRSQRHVKTRHTAPNTK